MLQFELECHNLSVDFMKQLNIREMRGVLGKLDVLVEEQQELIITGNNQFLMCWWKNSKN